MNFRHLSYFIAVAEELHFGRAAERLHVVQPGVSQQISRMEAELGVTLLRRTKRQVELTDAGRMFLAEARVLVERYEQAVAAARAAASGQAGSLVVGFVGPAAYSVLRSVVRPYRQRHPHVELILRELTSADQVDRITAGTLDAGFVRLPVSEARVESMHLISESIVVVLPEDHPQAANPVVDLSELSNESFMMAPRAREPSVFDQYMRVCARAGFSPRIGQAIAQIHTTIELVAVGVGVALAPASVANLRRPGVVCRPLLDAGLITTDTGLAWRRDNISAALQNFLAIAKETFADVKSAQ